MLAVGDKAPDFSLPDSTGNIVSLKDFRGKKLVLYFYPEDGTPTCTKQACMFRDNLARVRTKGAEIIGVSANTQKSHQKFAQKYDLPFTLLSDESKAMINAYGVWGKKSLFGHKYMGIIRTTFIINERGSIVHVFENVRIKGHLDNILEKL